jgi:hypothetical protein
MSTSGTAISPATETSRPFTVRRAAKIGSVVVSAWRVQMPTFVAALARHVKLFHRHAMLHGSHERTSGRPTAQWSRLDAGRSDDLGPKS